jgi:hypothetical protein
MFALDFLAQTPPPLPPQSIQSSALDFLGQFLQIVSTAAGVGVAAYVLFYKHSDAIIKQVKEIKNLTNRNNANIENRSAEIQIKTDGLYGFIDQIQKHQASAIGEANQKISEVQNELEKNTELTSDNCQRIEQLEKLLNKKDE